MSVYRTPDDHFDGLPGFDFEVHWTEWRGLRLAHLDEGDGPPVVLFHGEPTWSFLYRKMIPVLVAAGYRVVVPDLPGFGRSDKPTDSAFYTYDTLTEAAAGVLEHVGVGDATAVVQDWGGPIGLRVVVDAPQRFSRICILNTWLPGGGEALSPGFLAWRSFVERTPDLPIGKLMANAAVRAWPDEVIAGYEAPFPVRDAKAGAARLPLIVPLQATDPGAAEMRRVRTALKGWDGPAQVLFSTEDPIFPPSAGERWAELLPTADGLETVERAGHFLQEDAGEEVAAGIVAFLDRTG